MRAAVQSWSKRFGTTVLDSLLNRLNHLGPIELSHPPLALPLGPILLFLHVFTDRDGNKEEWSFNLLNRLQIKQLKTIFTTVVNWGNETLKPGSWREDSQKVYELVNNCDKS